MTSELIETAAELLSSSSAPVISTGAGMSRESGIPTFREAMDGLWAQFDPQQLATEAAFKRDPSRVWSWYEHRRRTVLNCRPHSGHLALVELATLLPGLTLITQNVDGLHAAAGSPEVLELHGNIMRSRCSDCARPAPTPDPGTEGVENEPPACESCGSPIRPDVVWFGEMFPLQLLDRAWAKSAAADVILVIGTSGVVWPAAELPRLTKQGGGKMIEVNTVASQLTPLADIFIPGAAGEVVPALVSAIRRTRGER